jgi:hypothetical protein
MNLFISPHNDDAVLFGAFTLMREKPVVVTVTDSWIQYNRGEKITADQRWQEDVNAMKILGCPIIRLGLRDDIIDEWFVRHELSKFVGFEKVYAPAVLEGGNEHHNLIGKVAKDIFGQACNGYITYTKTNLHLTGNIEVKPTPNEFELKEIALRCYISQINLPSTKPHFDTAGGSEWFI